MLVPTLLSGLRRPSDRARRDSAPPSRPLLPKLVIGGLVAVDVAATVVMLWAAG